MLPSPAKMWQANEAANWHCKRHLPGPGSREAKNGGTEFLQTVPASFLESVTAEFTP